MESNIINQVQAIAKSIYTLIKTLTTKLEQTITDLLL